jgi:hypothetical protein
MVLRWGNFEGVEKLIGKVLPDYGLDLCGEVEEHYSCYVGVDCGFFASVGFWPFLQDLNVYIKIKKIYQRVV